MSNDEEDLRREIILEHWRMGQLIVQELRRTPAGATSLWVEQLARRMSQGIGGGWAEEFPKSIARIEENLNNPEMFNLYAKGFATTDRNEIMQRMIETKTRAITDIRLVDMGLREEWGHCEAMNARTEGREPPQIQSQLYPREPAHRPRRGLGALFSW